MFGILKQGLPKGDLSERFFNTLMVQFIGNLIKNKNIKNTYLNGNEYSEQTTLFVLHYKDGIFFEIISITVLVRC